MGFATGWRHHAVVGWPDDIFLDDHDKVGAPTSKNPPAAVPAGVSVALRTKPTVCSAGNQTGLPIGWGVRHRRWLATLTLCQRLVSHGHGSVSPIHDQARLICAAELTADGQWPTW